MTISFIPSTNACGCSAPIKLYATKGPATREANLRNSAPLLNKLFYYDVFFIECEGFYVVETLRNCEHLEN